MASNTVCVCYCFFIRSCARSGPEVCVLLLSDMVEKTCLHPVTLVAWLWDSPLGCQDRKSNSVESMDSTRSRRYCVKRMQIWLGLVRTKPHNHRHSMFYSYVAWLLSSLKLTWRFRLVQITVCVHVYALAYVCASASELNIV